MEVWRGRPVITGKDHPITVYKALLRSVALANHELSDEHSALWRKTAQDSWETLRDGFGFIHPDQELWRPNGEARLYMSMDDLEYVMVGYGTRMLDEDPNKYNDEIDRVNEVLIAIDKVLNRKKY